jgi:acetylornithine deacetylase
VAVFIANEENSRILGIGVDELVKKGELEFLKKGPIFWVDVADKKPCIGTGGVAAWTLKARGIARTGRQQLLQYQHPDVFVIIPAPPGVQAYGKLFHSGMPHLGINPMELAMEALSVVQRRFYADYPPHPQEAVYGFASCTSMKPTQMR